MEVMDATTSSKASTPMNSTPMNFPMNSRTNPLKKLWWWLRQITGEAAYENYLAHRRMSPQDSNIATMTREQFYADSLHRKYSTINRCC
jgi:uncharacterized short protein YbdD (DUF466 family)